jgi:SAM-dependent methyltransferase
LGGLPTQPVCRLLDANDQDVIADIGCGNGFLAEKIAFNRYVGIDCDAQMIKAARERNLPRSEFVLGDALQYDFKSLAPTKAVLYGVLHHLTDEEAVCLLRMLGSYVSQSIVTLDPVYRPNHPINNLLCRLDRGRYVRDEQAMLDLIKKTDWVIDTKLNHSANTKVADYLSFRLKPRR